MKRLILALAVILVGCGGAAAAEHQTTAKCELKRFVQLDMERSPKGGLVIPVIFSGHERKLLLQPNFTDSYVTDDLPELASAKRRTFSPKSVHQYDSVNGIPIHEDAIFEDVQLGGIKGVISANVGPRRDLPPGIYGFLGLDVMETFDIDLDFGRGKINLFSPEHCAGQVVYWSDDFVRIPLSPRVVGVSFPVLLDGKPLQAGLDLSAASAFMAAGKARELYGAAKPAFHELSFGGVTIKNPQIRLVPDSVARTCLTVHLDPGARCLGELDVWLGMSELEHLHLYFAFGENALYVTAADAYRGQPKKITP